jgi:hypothetical protein
VSVQTVVVPFSIGALASVEFSTADSVSIVTSPFTGQTQAQQWPGADSWSGTMTFPPLTQTQADVAISFLMQCRGMAIPFLYGDPAKRVPRGSAFSGTSAPIADTSFTMVAGGQVLHTTGWFNAQTGLLLAGDYIQIGYRLHRVLDSVTSNSIGQAPINIWPSLREPPTTGEAIVFTNPVGLFRLATNKRTWSADADHITKLSFSIMEYR